MKRILIFIFLILNINAEIKLDFSSQNLDYDSDYYEIQGNNIIISNYYNSYNNVFRFTGISFDKYIIISSNVQIYLDLLLFSTTGKSAPIIINENYKVSFVLQGMSTIIDSSENEKDAVIYLKKGASLNITGNGTLNIITNKLMAIKGDNSTSLILNNGTIKIFSTKTKAGGIYLKNNIEINNGNFFYEALSGKNPGIISDNSLVINGGNINIKSGEGKGILVNNSIVINKGILNLISEGENVIQTDNSIYIKEGNLNIKSEGGKGISVKKNLYIGSKGEKNSKLNINIDTNKEGIESKIMEIYSGTVNIKSKGDGIKLCKDQISSGESNCYMDIYEGVININSEQNGLILNGDTFIVGGKLILFSSSKGDFQPIIQKGLLKIIGGILFAGGNKLNIATNTEQVSSSYNKHIDAGWNIEIFDNKTHNLIISVTIPKDIEFFYFNNPFNFTMKFSEKKEEIEESPSQTLISTEIEYNYTYSTIPSQTLISTEIEYNYTYSTIPKQTQIDDKDEKNNTSPKEKENTDKIIEEEENLNTNDNSNKKNNDEDKNKEKKIKNNYLRKINIIYFIFYIILLW